MLYCTVLCCTVLYPSRKRSLHPSSATRWLAHLTARLSSTSCKKAPAHGTSLSLPTLSHSQLIPAKLVDAAGKEYDTKEALAGKVRMFYFSAHWCPPCK